MAVASRHTGKYDVFPKEPIIGKIISFLESKNFQSYNAAFSGAGTGMVKDSKRTGKWYYNTGLCTDDQRAWWISFTDGKLKFFIRCGPESKEEWYDSYRISRHPLSEPDKYGSYDAIRNEITEYFKWQ